MLIKIVKVRVGFVSDVIIGNGSKIALGEVPAQHPVEIVFHIGSQMGCRIEKSGRCIVFFGVLETAIELHIPIGHIKGLEIGRRHVHGIIGKP